MLALSFPTTLDGYKAIGGGLASRTDGARGYQPFTLDAPEGQQFLGASGSLNALESNGGPVVERLPAAVEMIISPGGNCVQVIIAASIPDDSRAYTLTGTAIAVNQPLNSGADH